MFLVCVYNKYMVPDAILNKTFSTKGIFGDFASGCSVDIQKTFLKNSAFCIFFPCDYALRSNALGLHLPHEHIDPPE